MPVKIRKMSEVGCANCGDASDGAGDCTVSLVKERSHPTDEHPWVTNKKWKKRWSDMDAQERQQFVDWYNAENGEDVMVYVHAGKNEMLREKIDDFVPFRGLAVVSVLGEGRLVVLPDHAGPALKGKAKRDFAELYDTLLILPNSIMLAREEAL